MDYERKPEETIARRDVQRLVLNLRDTADDLLDQLAGDEIRIDQILANTRSMARTARRISRKAHWPTSGEPAPGNESEGRRSGSRDRR